MSGCYYTQLPTGAHQAIGETTGTNTGLYKFGERYYNPSTMRWTQLDPSGQNPGYVLAGDDPVNQFDPSGTTDLSYQQQGQIVGGILGCGIGAFGFSEGGPIGFGIGCSIGAPIGVKVGSDIGYTIDAYSAIRQDFQALGL